MAKKLFIDPGEMRKSGQIDFSSIPVNQYNKTVQDELENLSKEDLVRIYRDMAIIREFEEMLYAIKTTGEYRHTPYDYPGPAHLSVGQEASVVGQAFLLDKDDLIFGSHRSHGEILAKGLSAIEKMTAQELTQIMEDYLDGTILAAVRRIKDGTTAVKDLAITFLLYGTLAEIFGRQTGFQMGLGGSMHAFFTPFGVYPNNAIVGGSAAIALGSALFKKINQKKGIVISNVGDGSLGCGVVWEALNMASMGQFRELWDGEYQGGLPIIFNFFNNQYGMGGQTAGETMGFDFLARIGAGINPEQMHAERIDGYNPLAVIDAMRNKRQLLEEKRGPVLLDTVTYRFAGHSPSDSSSYRTKEEIEAWQQHDSLVTYGLELVRFGLATEEDLQGIREAIVELVQSVVKLAVDEDISPRMDLPGDPDLIERFMFSEQRVEKMDDRPCEVLISREENPRVQQIQRKLRTKVEAGQSGLRTFQLRDAIFEAILDKFYVDPTLVAYGEDVRDWGGAFAVYRGLTEALPYHRFFNAPISEAAIVSSGVGYVLSGGRAIIELMYCDFLGRAGDEVFNQMAKWQAMSAGELQMPLVLRVSVGSKYGAQHSQDWTALPAHIPGLKVVFPATPYDAKGLMNSALMGTDPVIFFESQRIYDVGEMFRPEVPEGYYEVPIGEPDVKREGTVLTILSIGATLYRAVKAADILEERYGVSAEVIDARSLVPFNYEPVLESVAKTGRILLTSDACERASYLKEMAQTVSELAFDDLDAPPVVVGARNWITPAHELEEFFFPQPEWMIDAVDAKIMPLEGHSPKRRVSRNTQIIRKKSGL